MAYFFDGLSKFIALVLFQMPDEVNQEMDRMNIKSNSKLRGLRIKKVKQSGNA